MRVGRVSIEVTIDLKKDSISAQIARGPKKIQRVDSLTDFRFFIADFFPGYIKCNKIQPTIIDWLNIYDSIQNNPQIFPAFFSYIGANSNNVINTT